MSIESGGSSQAPISS
jgi:hypothetical protein